MGFEWNIVDKVGRDQQELDPSNQQGHFKMPKPAVGKNHWMGSLCQMENFAVIALTKKSMKVV